MQQKLDIATAKQVFAEIWRNRPVSWRAFAAKCSKTHITHETVKEYAAMTRDAQGRIKDVGGFVGGLLRDGKRKVDAVVHRQLVCLDADFAQPDLWELYQLIYGQAAMVYTTHKHTPEAPRYRLIIPLDRPVSVEEYEPIARRIAGELGIENFDHTTYAVNRVMYYPSTSKDGEFFTDTLHGEFLSADEILATYHNWRDVSEWPTGERETKTHLTDLKRQEDPTAKEGLVGCFCRQHTIEEVLEAMLPDVYTPTDTADNRYTYVDGTTSGGMITYDGKFAYSHHNTDPAGGKLLNAFDLVRVHKFGHLDDTAKPDTPTNRLPSYTAMSEFAANDPETKHAMITERIVKRATAQEDFADEYEDFTQPAPVIEVGEWVTELDVDKKGNVLHTIQNVITIMTNDAKLIGTMGYDDFEKREIALRNLPWRIADSWTRYLTDNDSANLRNYLERFYGITSVGKIDDGEKIGIMINKSNPVKDYLSGLVWDGKNRLEDCLSVYLGAEDTEYVRAVTRKTFTAAVARIFEPGIKFDNVLTLLGSQGIGKSTFIQIMGGKWFSDSFGDVENGNKAVEQLQGVWLMEIGELAGLKKASVEAIKHFISKREDRYRVAYGKRVELFPRQCIFIGTTNTWDFLTDPTGNRRFWVIALEAARAVKSVWNDLPGERDQIWAEAVESYLLGEDLFLEPSLEDVARQVQTNHVESDEWTLPIAAWLEQPDDEGKQRTRVCALDIWIEVIGGQVKDVNSYNTKRIHNILRQLPDWEPSQSKAMFHQYGTKQKAYYRKTFTPGNSLKNPTFNDN